MPGCMRSNSTLTALPAPNAQRAFLSLVGGWAFPAHRTEPLVSMRTVLLSLNTISIRYLGTFRPRNLLFGKIFFMGSMYPTVNYSSII